MWGASVCQVQLHLDTLHDQIFPSLSSDSTGIFQEHNTRIHCAQIVKEWLRRPHCLTCTGHRRVQISTPLRFFWDVLCKTSCSPIINAKLWMETNVVTLPKFIRDSNVTGDLGRFWSMWLFLFCRAEYDSRHYTFLILLFSTASFRGHLSESFASISPSPSKRLIPSLHHISHLPPFTSHSPYI